MINRIHFGKRCAWNCSYSQRKDFGAVPCFSFYVEMLIMIKLEQCRSLNILRLLLQELPDFEWNSGRNFQSLFIKQSWLVFQFYDSLKTWIQTCYLSDPAALEGKPVSHIWFFGVHPGVSLHTMCCSSLAAKCVWKSGRRPQCPVQLELTQTEKLKPKEITR